MFRFPSRPWAVWLIALAFFVPATAADDDLGSIFAALESPQLGPAAQISNHVIAHQRLMLHLGAGTLAPILVGNETVGMYFMGSGTYAYQSTDQVERSALLYNVREVTEIEPRETEEGILLEGEFNSFLLWGPDRYLPSGIAAVAAPEFAAAFAKHRERFSKVRLPPAELTIARQKLDPAPGPAVQVEIVGGKKDLIYTSDPFDERSESLMAVRTSRSRYTPDLPSGSSWPVLLSEQPVGRDRRAFRQPLYILTGVDLDIEATHRKDVKIRVRETIVPQVRDQKTFLFRLLSWRSDGEKLRTFNLHKVTDAEGRELSFVHREHRVLVELPEPAAPNQAFDLTFDISGDFLIRPGGDNYWRLGTEPWFPQPGLAGQYLKARMSVAVEKPFVPLVPGNVVVRDETETHNRVEATIEHPVQFLSILAGKYHVHEETHEGLTIRVATYAGKNEKATKKLGTLALKLIRFYEPWLGPFPFEEYNIIEINQLGWGQAPPATMFITREAFTPQRERSYGINDVFAHEIAHQYWGHVVKMGSYEEQWLTEAFAEYSAALAMKRLFGEGRYKSIRSGWKAAAKKSSKVTSIPMANRVARANIDGAYARRQLLYDKGALLLAHLHDQVGDDHFLSWMRSTQGVFAWRFATTDGLQALLERITGEQHGPFFEEYFWGTAMPK